MRRSEFERAVEDEFGAAYGSVVTTDLGLSALGGKTAADAIAAGIDPREVWIALCDATDVPRERRYGVGRLEPRS